MDAQDVLVVTAFDGRYLDLAEDMAASFRRAYQDRYRLAAVVFGGCEPPAALASQFDVLVRVPPVAALDSAHGYDLAYLGIKPRLRELFPGYASYCWVDADCWFQGAESLPRILAGVPGFAIAIHPEFDVHYLNYPTPSDRTLRIYETNEGDSLDGMPLRMPMLNAGVFAMKADSPVWSLWEAELRSLRQRYDAGEKVYFSDQIPLHKVVYQHKLSVYPLRAVDNWQTCASLPFVHRPSKLLRLPTPPYEPLGIVHLAGATIKTRSFAVDGGTTTLRYRDLLRFFGDQAAI